MSNERHDLGAINEAALSGYPGDDPAMDEPCGPSDEEMLDSLDAYGHLRFTVGETYAGDEDRDSLTCLAFDWNVFAHPEHRLGDLIVAYEVVIDDEVTGNTDTVESGLFCIDGWTEEEIRKWGGAPLVNCVDNVNVALDLGGSCGFITFETVEEFQATVTKQFVEDVARARRELDGQGEEGGR